LFVHVTAKGRGQIYHHLPSYEFANKEKKSKEEEKRRPHHNRFPGKLEMYGAIP